MMRLTKNQWSIINAAVKPFRLTTRYLNDKLTRILVHHLNYFAKCRHIIDHGKPIQQNNHFVTLQFNKLLKKGGFIHKRLPTTWTFYGALLLTRFGRDEQRRLRKRKRAKSATNKAAGSGKLANSASATKKTKAIISNTADLHADAVESGSKPAIELYRLTTNNGPISVAEITSTGSDCPESDISMSIFTDVTRTSFSDNHDKGF